MHDSIPFFFFVLITVSANLLPSDKVAFTDNQIITTVDLTDNVETVNTFDQIIGEIIESFTKQVELIASDGTEIILENVLLETISIKIPDQTTISGPEEWDNTIAPPTEIPTTGEIPSGFQTPESVIQVGSPDVVLIFDQTVTIILEGVTGQTAYKLPGEEIWNLINDCTGTYDEPVDPVFPSECSISDGIDTKIVTFHFTEFGEFEEIVEEITQTSSSGGSHRTGVSVVNPKINDEIKNSSVLPVWLTHPVLWWTSDQITDQEFSSIIGYLIDEDVIKIENKTKPEEHAISMAPATKHLFSLWERDILSESVILKLVEKYRVYGVW